VAFTTKLILDVLDKFQTPTIIASDHRARPAPQRSPVKRFERTADLIWGIERLEGLNDSYCCLLPLASSLFVVPDVTREEIAVSSRHRSFLEALFHAQKGASKLLNDAFYCMLGC
jgi:hypothetical protein